MEHGGRGAELETKKNAVANWVGVGNRNHILLRRKSGQLVVLKHPAPVNMSGLFMCIGMLKEIKRWKFTCLSQCLCNTHITSHFPSMFGMRNLLRWGYSRESLKSESWTGDCSFFSIWVACTRACCGRGEWGRVTWRNTGESMRQNVSLHLFPLFLWFSAV